MAITNLVAIKFSNEQLRPMADLLGQTYHSAKKLLDTWAAIDGATLFPKTADVIEDGAAGDGRVVITGNMVNAIITNLQALVTDFEATGGVKLAAILKVGVNTQTKLR